MADLIPLKRNGDQIVTLTVSTDGVAVDITGWAIAMAIKDSLTKTDDEALLYKEAIIDNTAGGLAHITFSKDDEWPEEGDYYYDFRVRDAAGKERNTQQGSCSISEIVTQEIQ